MPALSVLHVAQSSEYGLGGYMLQVVEAEVGAGWTVAVAGHPDSWLRSRAIAAGATWHDWVAARDPGVGVASELRNLRRIVRGVAADVVHLHSSKAGLVGRLVVRRRTPTIFQPHGWSFFAMSGGARRAAIAWERLATRWADQVLCVSDSERQAGESVSIRAPWRVVATGVDARQFAPGDRAAARQVLGLGESPMVVCAGRVAVGQKGQDVLLAAWATVERAVPGATLVILGDGPDRERLERSAPPTVLFPGERDDVARWFQAANVISQPSRYEGFSQSVLEALACARSVVVTDSVGMRESVADAGGVVPIDDVDALAAAIVQRLSDPALADAEGQRGRARVIEAFTPDRWRSGILEATSAVVR